MSNFVLGRYERVFLGRMRYVTPVFGNTDSILQSVRNDRHNLKQVSRIFHGSIGMDPYNAIKKDVLREPVSAYPTSSLARNSQ